MTDHTLARRYASNAATIAAQHARDADALARSIIRLTDVPATMDAACHVAIRVGELACIALDFATEAQTSARADWLCDLAQDACSAAGELYGELQTLGHETVRKYYRD